MGLTPPDSSLSGECRAVGDPVVVTGAGLVTCLGLDRRSTWSRVVRGECGFQPLTAIESPLSPTETGGQAPDLPVDLADESPREVAYLRLALREALREAGALESLPYPARRCGLVLGTTLHGMRHAGRFLRTGDPAALSGFLAGSTVREATAGLRLEGFATTLCSACSSGLASICAAKTLLDAGVLDLVVAGGYDAISEYSYGGFCSMRLVTQTRPRPFSRNRDGMKLGEGYAVVVLERASQARARGRKPFAEILGLGESSDAHHLSKPHPQGAGAAGAMAGALRRARRSPRDIDAIFAHATATPDNDAAELAALTTVFSTTLDSIPVVAFKTHLGHTLGAAGAVELILSMTALGDQVIPPCAGGASEETAFPGLRLVTGDPKRVKLRTTLNTSLGFGGCNTSVVLGTPGGNVETSKRRNVETYVGRVPPAASSQTNGLKADEGDCEARRISPQIDNRQSTIANPAKHDHSVAITGIGVLFPGVIGVDAFRGRLEVPGPHDVGERTGTILADELDALLRSRRARRISEYVRLTLGATALAYEDAGIADLEAFGEDCNAILGTTHGATAFSAAYYRQIVAEGVQAANPMLFAEGVPNGAAAHLSTNFSIKGLCQTAIGTRTAGLEALMLAAMRIRTGVWSRAVVSAADEFFPLVNEVYQFFGLHGDSSDEPERNRARGFLTSCGAVTLILEPKEAALRRGVSWWGEVGESAAVRCSDPASRAGTAGVGDVWSALGRPDRVMGSSNGTWIDRVECSAFSRRAASNGNRPVLSSVYGHIAECFSAGPLAAVAAVLVRGRLPRWRLSPPARVLAADGTEAADRFGVIATDYAGSCLGIGLRGAGGARAKRASGEEAIAQG